MFSIVPVAVTCYKLVFSSVLFHLPRLIHWLSITYQYSTRAVMHSMLAWGHLNTKRTFGKKWDSEIMLGDVLSSSWEIKQYTTPLGWRSRWFLTHCLSPRFVQLSLVLRPMCTSSQKEVNSIPNIRCKKLTISIKLHAHVIQRYQLLYWLDNKSSIIFQESNSCEIPTDHISRRCMHGQ